MSSAPIDFERINRAALARLLSLLQVAITLSLRDERRIIKSEQSSPLTRTYMEPRPDITVELIGHDGKRLRNSGPVSRGDAECRSAARRRLLQEITTTYCRPACSGLRSSSLQKWPPAHARTLEEHGRRLPLCAADVLKRGFARFALRNPLLPQLICCDEAG